MSKTLCYFVFLQVVFLNNVICFMHDVDYEGWLNIKLEHSFSSTHEAEYTERGNISIQAGVSSVTNFPLPLSDTTKLQLLGRENKFYRLKAIVSNNDGSETTFMTFIKACMLLQANLNDFLTISLDHNNNVVGISIGVHSNIACEGADLPLDKIEKFYTKVIIMPISNGPVPDTASYIQKMEREREAKERGDVKDNRTFLAKYWMYILPVVIIMVLSSAANPDGAAGGSGRQG